MLQLLLSNGYNSASLCLLSAPPPQHHFCFSFHLIYLRDQIQGAQDFFGFRSSNSRVWQQDPLTAWEVTCRRSWRKSASDMRPEPWALVFWHRTSTASASVLPWAPKEMSVTRLKDRGELWEWEPSRVTRFHAVSLIFCLASEIYFTRRWERTWNKIDLGWANIWQRSVGNNHLSWEISTPGDIDGTKNICLSPQSQGIQFSSVESHNSSAVNLLFIFIFGVLTYQVCSERVPFVQDAAAHVLAPRLSGNYRGAAER